jgi:hypothetical protein
LVQDSPVFLCEGQRWLGRQALIIGRTRAIALAALQAKTSHFNLSGEQELAFLQFKVPNLQGLVAQTLSILQPNSKQGERRER